MNKTTIEWTDRTWNPVTGCTKVSQGCKNCYAERIYERFNGFGTFKLVHLHPDRLGAPKSWKSPSMIFVNSMSDLFHEHVPNYFIDEVFAMMAICKHHTFQILTKRPHRMLEWFNHKDMGWRDPGMRGDERIRYQCYHSFGERIDYKNWQWPLPNVWIGVSVEDQETADLRIPLLLQIPAAVRFLSCEPLLGPVDIEKCPIPRIEKRRQDGSVVRLSKTAYLDWVICGGESGPGARPMHPDWARGLRDQCAQSEIPFFFKQWGQWLPFQETAQPPFYKRCSDGEEFDGHQMGFLNENNEPGKWQGGRWLDTLDAFLIYQGTIGCACMFLSVGKKKAGHLLDGKVHNEFPNLQK